MKRKTLLLLLLLAALVRIPVFMLAARGHFIVGEGRVQIDLAENIISGRGFQLSPSMLYPSRSETSEARDFQMEFYRRVDGFYGVLRPGRPTTFLVPGNALFFAGLILLFGGTSIASILAVQFTLGILTVALGIRIASRFLSGRWLIAAGALMAVDPFELYYEAIPATQALFSLVLMTGLILSIRLLERPGATRGILAGLAWGVAFMVRPAALPIAALVLLLNILGHRFSRASLAAGALLVLCFCAALLPWGLRNRAVTGDLSVMPTQGGLQLWEYNGRVFSENFRHELRGASLLYEPVRERWLGRLASPELAEFPEFTDESEAYRDSVLYHRQTLFLRRNPIVFLELVSLRFMEFFKPFPLNDFSVYHTIAGLLFFFWISALMVPGGILLMLDLDPRGILVALGAWGYSLMHLLVASGTPHRVAIDFLLIVMAMRTLRVFWLRSRA
jgi:hypothetical protein